LNKLAPLPPHGELVTKHQAESRQFLPDDQANVLMALLQGQKTLVLSWCG
jgi:hypothetical protein